MKSNLDKKLVGSLSLADVIHFAIAVLVFAAISWIYFYPNDMNGDVLQQNDIMQGIANSQEINTYEAQTGEKPLWQGMSSSARKALAAFLPYSLRGVPTNANSFIV